MLWAVAQGPADRMTPLLHLGREGTARIALTERMRTRIRTQK